MPALTYKVDHNVLVIYIGALWAEPVDKGQFLLYRAFSWVHWSYPSWDPPILVTWYGTFLDSP